MSYAIISPMFLNMVYNIYIYIYPGIYIVHIHLNSNLTISCKDKENTEMCRVTVLQATIVPSVLLKFGDQGAIKHVIHHIKNKGKNKTTSGGVIGGSGGCLKGGKLRVKKVYSPEAAVFVCVYGSGTLQTGTAVYTVLYPVLNYRTKYCYTQLQPQIKNRSISQPDQQGAVMGPDQ